MKKLLSGIALCAVAALLIGASHQEGEKAEEEKPPQTPGGYAWVALQVSDVEEAAKFFKDKLNFKGQAAGEYYLFQVDDRQYFVLLEKQGEDIKSNGMMVSFHIKNVDDYFKQVTDKGVEAVDYLDDFSKMERPKWRDWGSKEFAVKGPEDTLLVFTKMGE
jgi:predicted enzyme related to lactoylglutathione lyase